MTRGPPRPAVSTHDDVVVVVVALPLYRSNSFRQNPVRKQSYSHRMASDIEAPRLEEQLLPEQQEVGLNSTSYSLVQRQQAYPRPSIAVQDGTECAGTA